MTRPFVPVMNEYRESQDAALRAAELLYVYVMTIYQTHKAIAPDSPLADRRLGELLENYASAMYGPRVNP